MYLLDFWFKITKDLRIKCWTFKRVFVTFANMLASKKIHTYILNCTWDMYVDTMTTTKMHARPNLSQSRCQECQCISFCEHDDDHQPKDNDVCCYSITCCQWIKQALQIFFVAGSYILTVFDFCKGFGRSLSQHIWHSVRLLDGHKPQFQPHWELSSVIEGWGLQPTSLPASSYWTLHLELCLG